MSQYYKARVRSGHLMLDEPTELPDGTEIELVVAHPEDMLDDADRARLHAALERAAAQFREGLGIPAEVALRRLVGATDR